MSSLSHDTIAVERRFAHSRAKVFAAFETRQAQESWMCPAAGMTVRVDDFDFRAGGRSLILMSLPDVGSWENEDRYQDIRPGERIIQTTTLKQDGTLTCAGVISILFEDDGKGCLLRVTEQSVFLDGRDEAAMHEEGWRTMLENLAGYLGAR
jgi:uncharacterized protein YndB with AHSA1/START domain